MKPSEVGGTYLLFQDFTRKGRGYLLSLCNKNSDLNFQKFLLENEVGGTYLSFPGFY